MARGLEQVKADLIAADKAGDSAAVKRLQQEWYALQAAREKSLEAARQTPKTEIGNPEGGTTGIAEGVGSMLTNIGRRAVNLALPDAATPQWASDQAIQDQKELDRPLTESARGAIGQALGAIPGLSPVTVAANVTRALPATTRALAASRGARIGVPAAEGALAGELTDGDALGGAALNVTASSGANALRRALSGRERTPEAQRLLDKGIDLTPGQMKPGGYWNQLEETAQSWHVIGRPAAEARDAAKSQVLDKLLEQATGKAPSSQKFSDAIQEVAESFGPRYAAAEGFPINNQTGILASRWQGIVSDPNHLASVDAANRVGRFLKNQLSAIPPQATTTEWLKIRTNIRDAARTARKSATSTDERAMADMLDEAAEAMTVHIEGAMPAPVALALQQVDTDYAKYKAIEKAFYAAGVRPEGPTMRELGNALKRTMSQSQWAKGKGGESRELIEDAAAAFESKTPATGVRAIPALSRYTVVPVVAGGIAAAVPAIRHAAQGNTAAQKALRKSLNDPVMRDIIDLLRANRVPAVGAVPSPNE